MKHCRTNITELVHFFNFLVRYEMFTKIKKPTLKRNKFA